MCRRIGVFVVRLDAQACSKAARSARFNEGNTNERTPVFRRPARRTTRKKFVDAVGLQQTSKRERKYA